MNPDGAGKLRATSPQRVTDAVGTTLYKGTQPPTQTGSWVVTHFMALAGLHTPLCPVTHSASPPPPHKLCRAPTEVTVSPPSTAHAERAHAVALLHNPGLSSPRAAGPEIRAGQERSHSNRDEMGETKGKRLALVCCPCKTASISQMWARPAPPGGSQE